MKLLEWFTDASRWNQGPFAKGYGDIPVASSSEDAVSTCLLGGAVRCIENPEIRTTVLNKIASIAKRLYPDRGGAGTGYSIVTFNEHHDTTFADVRKVLEEAQV